MSEKCPECGEQYKAIDTPVQTGNAKGLFDHIVGGHDCLQNQLTQSQARVQKLEAMRVHCPNCGGDYMETGVECGCQCQLIKRSHVI